MSNKPIDRYSMGGVWSAAPTPLTEYMDIHTDDIMYMVDHHIRLGVKGLFIAGTNGEGPWLPRRERKRLLRTVIHDACGKLYIAFQVTDNSSARIIDNMRMAEDEGADISVIAPPDFFMNACYKTLKDHYLSAIEQSRLPVGIYDRGTFGPVTIPSRVLKSVYDHKKVVLIKDSSMNPDNARIALDARKKRPSLCLLNGYEFGCVEYLEKGYDGLLLGGGVFNGYLAGKIIEAVHSGKITEAHRLQKRMNRIMYAVYGGKDITCWLAGEKKLLVDMKLFSTWKNFPNYPLRRSCIRAIEKVLERDADVLLP